VLSLAGFVLFWMPYQVTGAIVRRLKLERDVLSTWKLLLGAPVYLVWLAALATAALLTLSRGMAALVIVTVPVMGIVGLLYRERWRLAWADTRRFFLLRSRRALVAALRERQRDLATRMDELQRDYTAQGVA
jgi:hypothetical protein